MTVNKNIFDVVIIGSGIAGITIGAELSKDISVCILEKEKVTSFHSTGRSFAFFLESYGNEVIRKLTTASKDFFLENSMSDNDTPVLKKRGVLHIATEDQHQVLMNTYQDLTTINKNLSLLNKSDTIKLLPCLNEKYAYSSIYDDQASDIDVNTLYNLYLKKFKTNNGVIKTKTIINKYVQQKESWQILTQEGSLYCKLIVNAAGAWCDEVAEAVNTKKINIIPKKRTVFCFKPDNLIAKNHWPLGVDINENFYFKVENQNILGSPADETPTVPHDAQADELDIAIGAEKIQKATKIKFKSIINKWAGLRNFVEDKTPVIGYDNHINNFFWIAGQGGYGIQTSPALAKISSNMILNKKNNYYEDKFKINLASLNIKRLI